MVTHSAFLLVANVVLVQSSFGVQPQPEVTARGHLRGNSTTVTTTAPAGINETAEADEDVPATLALDVEMNASLEYFDSQASEETPGGTIEEAGEETMATLGRRRRRPSCSKTYRQHADCLKCCKSYKTRFCSLVSISYPVSLKWKCLRSR